MAAHGRYAEYKTMQRMLMYNGGDARKIFIDTGY